MKARNEAHSSNPYRTPRRNWPQRSEIMLLRRVQAQSFRSVILNRVILLSMSHFWRLQEKKGALVVFVLCNVRKSLLEVIHWTYLSTRWLKMYCILECGNATCNSHAWELEAGRLLWVWILVYVVHSWPILSCSAGPVSKQPTTNQTRIPQVKAQSVYCGTNNRPSAKVYHWVELRWLSLMGR